MFTSPVNHRKSKADKTRPNRISVDAISIATPLFVVLLTMLFTASSSTWLLQWRSVGGGGSVVRFLPLFMLFFAVLITSVAQPFYRLVRNVRATITANWFLTGFFLMALPGSFYVRTFLNQPTSYFSQAFMILSFFCAYFIFVSIPDSYWNQVQNWLILAFGLIALIAVFTVFYDLVRGAEKSTPETSFLLTQGLGIAFYINRGFRKYFFFLLLATATLLTFKNTAVLILLVSCFGFYFFPKDRLRRLSLANIIGLSFIGLIILLALGLAYIFLQANYSAGHTEFRSQLIDYQVGQFLQSPLVGSLFTSETSVLYERDAVLVPSHNDIVDVLAQGGAIGILLFAGGFVSIIRSLLKVRRIEIKRDLISGRVASWLLFFIVAVIITASLNSIMGTRDTILIVWVGIAMAHRIVHRSVKHKLS